MFNNQQYEEEERQQQQRARDPYDEEVPPRQSTSLPRISVEIAATFRHRSTILSAKEEVIRMSGEKGHVALRVNDVAQSDSTHSGSTTPTDYDFHTVPLEELATRFTTNTEKGLDSGVAENRLQSDGPNLVIVRNYKWILDILGYYFGGICILLWPAVVLSILCYQPFGEPDPDPTNLGLAVVILIVIIIQGSFSLYQDYSSSKVMKSINAMLPQQAVVIRDGKQVSVPVYSLVRGDIVKIETGHRVPADLRLISVQNLKVDTSMLTGESDPLVCTLKPTDDNYMNSRNLLFMGSGIVEGVGYGMVVAIGNKTVMGRVAKLAAGTEKGTSTLRKEVHRMVIIVAIIGILTGLILITYWAAYLRVAYPGFMSTSAMISTVIGIIVAYVPEGLPLSLALTLTFIARHMKKLNVLVKKLSTVETLGSVNVIASDKTGTLTQNRMSVSDIFAGMRSVTVKSCVQLLENNDESFLESIRVLSLCNRAEYRVEQVRGEMSPDGAADQRRVIVGDASDTAFLTFCQDLQNISSMRSRYPKLAEIPFNSKNKYMLTIVREDANHVTLLMKGAAEQILARCTSYITSTGLEVPITDEDRSTIEREIEYFGRQGKRVLAGARLKLDPTIWSPTFEFNTEVVNFPMDGLCFVCLGCLIDPPRPDVPAAMDTLKTAGVRVLMVTGDHPTTAVAIAKIVGIISATSEIVRFSQATPLEPVNIGKNALCVLGQDVPTISKDQWDIIVKQYKEVVFARTTPEQKLTIVKEYQRCGCIVAATGDGTNDAPALKQANVGVAMGCGTDIAREAADIILIDNRFSSITIGIKYGRLAFDNLRKIVTYVLPSGNWAEMIPIALSAFMGIPLPLSAFLMIFICCATDVGPAMSLVTELPEGDIMHRKPRVESKERLIDIGLFLRAFAFLGSIECTAALVSFFLYFYWYAKITPYQLFFLFDNWADGFHGYTMNELNEFLYTAQTVYFVAIIGCQIGQLMTTRLTRLNFYQQWFWTNPVLLIGILIELLLAVLIIYLPLFNTLFKTRQPPVEFWFIPLAFGVVVFVLSEVLKVLRRISFAIFKHIKANIEAKKLQTIQAHEEINKL